MDKSSGSGNRWEYVDFELEILKGGPRERLVEEEWRRGI